MTLTPWEFGLRLLAALAAAAVIGWEREIRNRSAGLRTHMLVGLGACTFAVLALDFHLALRETTPPGPMAGDPLRAVDGIVGGIGFLGAGAIIRGNGEIRGLTTAAGIWAVAGIGTAAGFGRYALAGFATVAAWLTLWLLARLELRVAAAKKPEETDAPG